MSATAKFGKLALVVAAIMVFSALFIPGSGARSTVHDHELMASVDGMHMAYHYLSANEMQSLKKAIGVRNPDKNYNEIIDGHGTGLAPPSEKEWNSMVHHLKVVDSISGVRATRASMDLSKTKYFPPIGNQGQQGSCAAWAVNYYAHTIIEAEDNNWDAASGNRSYLMSPAWTYNLIDGGMDSGSTFGENAMVLKSWGSASMQTMPYVDTIYKGMGGPKAMREAPEHKIKDFYFINNTGKGMIYTIKQLIDKGIPVTFAVDADDFDNAFKDGNYIISSSEYSASLQPNHGQTIIGYDDFITDDGDVGAFKIANSWGAGWGDHGFYWITYKAFYTEVDYNNKAQPMYMVDIPHYQPKMLAVWEFNGTVEMNVNISVGIMTNNGMVWDHAFFVNETPVVHIPLPHVMAFDITPLYQYYQDGYRNISLKITTKYSEKGTVYQFRVEEYGAQYVLGMPEVISKNANGTPATIPCNVTLDFQGYNPISMATALDTSEFTFVTNMSFGQGGWVAAPYEHYKGTSAVRSVLVAPDSFGAGRAVLAAKINSGPGVLTFYCKISASSDAWLAVYQSDIYQGKVLRTKITSAQNWTKVSVKIGQGSRYIFWEFVNSGTTVKGEDAAWIDDVSWTKTTDSVPTAPTGLNASVGTGYVSLSWHASTASSSAPLTGYVILRGNSTQNMSMVGKVDANTLTYNDSFVENGKLYIYEVLAENYVGYSKASNIVKALPVEKPMNPRNLTANNTFGGVNLTWKAPRNVDAAGLSNYTIYRAENGTTNFVVVGTAPGNQLWFNDTTAKKGVKYDYYVVAENWMAKSPKSNVVSGMAYGTPYAPQNVKTQDGMGYVIITWSKPTNNGGAPITGYVIYRKAPGKDFVKVGEVGADKTTFKDTTVTNNIKYIYVVVAKNKFGEGNRSQEVSANPADIIINMGGSAIHMTYAMMGGIIAVIVLLIVGIVVLLKKRKKKARTKKEEPENEEKEAGEEEQANEETPEEVNEENAEEESSEEE